MNLLETDEFKQIVEKARNNPNTLALILFGSYAKGEQKPNSDVDLCIIRKEGTIPHDFEELDYKNKIYDIHFYDKLPDYIKFRIFSEAKVLVLNDEKTFKHIRRRFLYIFRDEYAFRQKQLKKMLNRI